MRLKSFRAEQFLSSFTDKVFLKFLIVGVVNTFVGTAVMFGSYNLLGMSYWVSSAANYIIGSVCSYILNKNYTFINREKGFMPMLKFIANIVVCYGVAYGCARPLVSMCLSGYDIFYQENIAMGIGMVIFVGMNYLGQRFFVFRH